MSNDDKRNDVKGVQQNFHNLTYVRAKKRRQTELKEQELRKEKREKEREEEIKKKKK